LLQAGTLKRARSFIITAWVCGAGVAGLFWPVACRAATPIVLASGLNSPVNILVDSTNVYWSEQPDAGDAGFPRQIGSVDKNSSGGAKISYNYTGDPVYASAGASGGSDYVLDGSYLYYIGLHFDGTYYLPAVCKVPKAGGASSVLSPGSVSQATLTIGSAGGVLYYGNQHQAPNDQDDNFGAVVALSTEGGGESVLTYSGYGWGAGGHYTLNATTWYYGLAALEYDKSQNTNFSYCFTKALGSSCTDGANLYWTDGTSIWSMPLNGRDPAILYTTTNRIYAMAAPTSGAAAGSLFWVETSGYMSSLKRRDPAGQVTVLISPNCSMFAYYRCFAVSGDKVYCGAAGGLVEVSIDAGPITVLAGPDYPFNPVSVATDENSIYWSGNGQIQRLARPGAAAGTPRLQTSHVGNTVTLSWQDASGWSLKQNNNLSVPAGWSPSSGITNSNGTNYLKIPSSTGNLFYRLSNP
jgi:hypothetical protein